MESIELISKMKCKLTLIVIFADVNKSQIDKEYYKILLDKNHELIHEYLTILSPNLEVCIMNLFKKYLNVGFEWPLKYLANARKNNEEIEITYICKMPYKQEYIKNGTIKNLRDIEGLEKYYEQIVSENSGRSFW